MPDWTSCEAVRNSLPAYLGGELAAEKSSAIASHINACVRCSELEQEERELNHLLRTGLTVDVERAQRLEQQVREKIDIPAVILPQKRARFGILDGRWWAAAAATLAFAVFALYFGPAIYTSRIAHRLCSDAVDDHQEEVVQQQPRKWRTADPDLQTLVARLGEQNLPKSAGNLTLEKARICELGGRNFIHAVYTSGQTEYSVFLAPVDKASAARPMPFSLVRAETINNIGVAEYHSNAQLLIVAGSAPVARILEISSQLTSVF